jgi:hypothetical protein
VLEIDPINYIFYVIGSKQINPAGSPAGFSAVAKPAP